MESSDRRLSEVTWNRHVDGYNLGGHSTLGEVLDAQGQAERTVLLVFLRYYG